VVLGCAQRRLRDDVGRRLGGRADVLMRDSGGGAVLTGPWLVSASVVLPHGHTWSAGGAIESYRRLGQLHLAALDEVGVPARCAPPPELTRGGEPCGLAVVDWACFGSLTAWELASADGRKLTGLAQRRCQAGVLLVAGTLVDAADWPLLCDAMGHPEHESTLRQRTSCASELAGRRIDADRFASVLSRHLTCALS
jgi:lipoate---protein ligase